MSSEPSAEPSAEGSEPGAVEARGVAYATGGRNLLHGVSAAFAPGRLHLVIGPNGAGKSTLIKLLARLLAPRDGRVLYGGEDVAGVGRQELARRRAVLSQAIEIAFPLAVREVVAMGRYPHFRGRPTAGDGAVVGQVLAFCDLEGLAERSYPTLSGGERQRVHFARVLAQIWRPRPATGRCLFLDEPLTFLDVGHQIDFMRKLRQLAAAPDLAIVGVVHDLALAARFADQLVLLHQGSLLAAGSPEEVMTAENVRRAFGVEPESAVTPDGRRHLVFE